MGNREKYEKLLNNKNVVAALHTIASVESALGAEGYQKVVGGSLVTLGVEHPRIFNAEVNSDAAGRYQFLSSTWDRINGEIGPLDFSNPRHQDIAGIWLLELRGVLEDVLKGDILTAMTGGHNPNLKHETSDVCYRTKSGMGCEWAGVYPNRYGQADHSLDFFLDNFDKYKTVPLPGASAPTDDTTDLSLVEGMVGVGTKTVMQAFNATVEYGTSSIMGFLGNTKRKALSYNMRICKVEGGHSLSGVKKIMGGQAEMTGYIPGMTNTAESSNSLKKGNFTSRPGAYINPAPGAAFVSSYGWRIHPIFGDERFHAGIDLAADEGTPILASGDGEISASHWVDGYGNQVKINHPDGMTTSYNHLLSSKVTVGQKVKQGEIIAEMGSTGNSTGPHLHFEIIKDGQAIDPVTIIPDLQE